MYQHQSQERDRLKDLEKLEEEMPANIFYKETFSAPQHSQSNEVI